MKRFSFVAIPISLVVAACGSARDLATDESSAESVAASSVEMATDKPGASYERLRRLTGYNEADCDGLDSEQAIAAARGDLQQRAADEGADYVRVIGNGPLAQRGRCSNDFYRVSGIAYSAQAEGEAVSGDDTGAADRESEPRSAQPERAGGETSGDRSPADKLADLEELRDKGLISDSEYEELRQEVLDESF